MKERLRFAPSPTGPLHIGGLRTALFNFLFARKHKGSFILRIEDTDKNRIEEGSEKYIKEALSWAGIDVDEGPFTEGNYGPYRQSERKSIYEEKIMILLKSKKAYYAFDSNENLEELRKIEEKNGKKFKYDYSNRLKLDNSLNLNERQIFERIKNEPYVIRLKVDPGETSINDVLRGNIIVKNKILDDKILIKADGYPTYHFANVVDDHLMKISTVIRGEEWLPSLAIHKLIYDAYGWETPKFIHLPLILKPQGKGKLSKRDSKEGGFPIFPLKWKEKLGYKELGFTNSGLINYLSLLGWNPGTEEEIFSLEELIDRFRIEGVQKGGAKFDYNKMKWINQKHISKISLDAFISFFPKKLNDLKKIFPKDYIKILRHIQKRISLISEFDKELNPFIQTPLKYDVVALNKLAKKNDLIDILSEIKKIIERKSINNLKENLYKVSEQKGIKFSIMMQSLRMSFIGNLSGPDLFFIAEIIKDSLSLKRVNKLINYLKKINTL